MIIVELKPCIIIHVTISKLGYKFTDNIIFYCGAEHQDNYLVSPLHLYVYNKIKLSLVEVINKMGNPFLHDGAELLVLDT